MPAASSSAVLTTDNAVILIKLCGKSMSRLARSGDHSHTSVWGDICMIDRAFRANPAWKITEETVKAGVYPPAFLLPSNTYTHIFAVHELRLLWLASYCYFVLNLYSKFLISYMNTCPIKPKKVADNSLTRSPFLIFSCSLWLSDNPVSPGFRWLSFL